MIVKLSRDESPLDCGSYARSRAIDSPYMATLYRHVKDLEIKRFSQKQKLRAGRPARSFTASRTLIGGHIWLAHLCR